MKIPSSVTSRVSLAGLALKNNSPRIMFVGGVAMFGATLVLTVRATLKVEGIVEDTDTKLHEVLVTPHLSDKQRTKRKALVYLDAAGSLTKLYGPAIITCAASIALLTGSHHVLSRKNAALGAAYAALDKGFKRYRNAVIDDLGEEKDREYRHAGRIETVNVVDDETGKVHSEKKKVATTTSEFGVVFHGGTPDERGNPNWQQFPEYNLIFLRGVENMMNDQLRAKGWLLLNDVYEALGFDRTDAGMVVGWLYNSDDVDSDGFVDFGIFNGREHLRVYDYVTGRDGEIYIDFNPDGEIFGLVGKVKAKADKQIGSKR